jgi:hypothetical protein
MLLLGLRVFVFLFMQYIALSCCNLSSAAGEDIDSILQGFEDNAPYDAVTDQSPELLGSDKPGMSAFASSIRTRISLEGIYAYHAHKSVSTDTDYHGITSLGSRLDVDMTARYRNTLRAVVSGHGYYDAAFELNGREQYTPETLSAYEKEFELDEGYLGVEIFQQGHLRVGRQVFSPGKFDMLGAQKVFNPVDLRQPGVTAAENVPLPLCMTRFDHSADKWSLSALMVHEFRLNKYPAFGSDFYPFSFQLPESESPGSGLEKQSYGLLAKTMRQGWDINLLLASYLAERYLLGINDLTQKRYIDRHTLVGLSLDRAVNGWVVKFEGDWSDNHQYYALEGQKSSQVNILAGVEGHVFFDINIAFEMQYRHLFGLNPETEDSDDIPYRDGLAWAVSVKRLFLNDLLSFNLSMVTLGYDFSRGALQKFVVSYALSDNISLKVGAVFYSGGDKYPFVNVKDNDRIFMRMELDY